MQVQETQNSPSTHQIETATALANLATATAADRSALAALTTTNEHLTKQLTGVTELLSLALSKINLLETSLNSVRCVPLPSQPQPGDKPPRNYCWTHGFRVSRHHNSTNCRTPNDGHKRETTATNRMGGSTVGMNST